jgi:hypothetical protein
MSAFSLDQTPDTTIQIKYNYPEINADHIQESTKMITANFFGKANEPNVIYTEPAKTSEKFQARKLYICGKIHTIEGTDYDGELIVEHISLSSNIKLYVCFLLKTDNTVKATEIDDIVKHSGEQIETLEINKYLSGSSKNIIYESTNPIRVIIYTNPIRIKENLANYSEKTTLFEVFNKNYKIVEIKIAKEEGFTGREGFVISNRNNIDENGLKSPQLVAENKNGDYLQCELANVSEDMIQTYQVPVLSDASKQNTSAIIVTYTLFLVVFIMTLFGIPYIHKHLHDFLFNEKNVKFIGDSTGAVPYNMIWYCIFWVPIVLLLGNSIHKTDFTLIAGGVMLILTFIISCMTIYNSLDKTIDPTKSYTIVQLLEKNKYSVGLGAFFGPILPIWLVYQFSK